MTAAYDDEYDNTPANGAAMVKTDVTSREVVAVTETASAAAAAMAVASIQARHAIARKFPRVFDDVRMALLKDCKRPKFAEAARYKKPQGKKKNEETGKYEQNFIEGPSIRFVEAAARLMGNFEVTSRTTYDDQAKRILWVEATDYETNASWGTEITIEKTVERRAYNAGQHGDLAKAAIRVRKNSYGDTVYILWATDDEIVTKQAAQVSKASRTLALRLLAADLVEECQEQCVATMRDKAAKDPDASRKELVAKFAAIGVKVADLIEYLGGRSLDEVSPDQHTELRIIGASINQGEATWRDYLASSPYIERPAEPDKSATNTKAAELRKKVEETKKSVAAKRAAKPAPKVDPATGEVSEEEQRGMPSADDDGR